MTCSQCRPVGGTPPVAGRSGRGRRDAVQSAGFLKPRDNEHLERSDRTEGKTPQAEEKPSNGVTHGREFAVDELYGR